MNADDECTLNATLECFVPVYIVIKDGRISRVVVYDEMLDVRTAQLVNRQDGDEITQKLAIDIATECEWPAWEFGW